MPIEMYVFDTVLVARVYCSVYVFAWICYIYFASTRKRLRSIIFVLTGDLKRFVTNKSFDI